MKTSLGVPDAEVVSFDTPPYTALRHPTGLVGLDHVLRPHRLDLKQLARLTILVERGWAAHRPTARRTVLVTPIPTREFVLGRCDVDAHAGAASFADVVRDAVAEAEARLHDASAGEALVPVPPDSAARTAVEAVAVRVVRTVDAIGALAAWELRHPGADAPSFEEVVRGSWRAGLHWWANGGVLRADVEEELRARSAAFPLWPDEITSRWLVVLASAPPWSDVLWDRDGGEADLRAHRGRSGDRRVDPYGWGGLRHPSPCRLSTLARGSLRSAGARLPPEVPPRSRRLRGSSRGSPLPRAGRTVAVEAVRAEQRVVRAVATGPGCTNRRSPAARDRSCCRRAGADGSR